MNLLMSCTGFDVPVTMHCDGRFMHCDGRFVVTYGEQVKTFDDLMQAIAEYESCVIHSATCAGMLD